MQVFKGGTEAGPKTWLPVLYMTVHIFTTPELIFMDGNLKLEYLAVYGRASAGGGVDWAPDTILLRTDRNVTTVVLRSVRQGRLKLHTKFLGQHWPSDSFSSWLLRLRFLFPSNPHRGLHSGTLRTSTHPTHCQNSGYARVQVSNGSNIRIDFTPFYLS